MKSRAATASLLLFIATLTTLAAVFGPTRPASANSDAVAYASSSAPTSSR